MILSRVAICLLLGLLVSCSTESSRAPSVGEAYVGPATLILRQELAPKAAASATVKHGEKLEILEYKRRFVKVRTAQGAEGWADTHLLLTPDQMAGLRGMAESAAHYPSQGAATVFEPLNMHTEPSRSSPSFWQIPENVKMDVIGHKLTPRIQSAKVSSPAPAAKPRPQRRRSKRGQASSSKIEPPPAPPAPKPPGNWLDLSVPKEDDIEPPKSNEAQPEPPSAPGPMDDWSLVRTGDGKVGWVLTRMLNMEIPDEVAQYAEGHRITSYFPIGEVRDGDAVKKNWLWTTIAKGLEPYEFDSFRVFVWSRKHHRYETAYIERKVTGHYPVRVDASGAVPSFSLILEGNDGHVYKKTYSFAGYHVRMVDKALYDMRPDSGTPHPATPTPSQAAPKARPWYAAIADRVRKLFH